MLGTCLVTLDWVWVDGHNFRAKSSWDVSVLSWQGILPRWKESLAGTYLGSGPRPGPHSFSDLSLLFGACPFCSCHSARLREPRLSSKDGKSKGDTQ